MIDAPDAPVDNLPPDERVAVVRAAIAPLLAEPRVSSPQTSQRLAWHPVEVLQAQGDWRRVRGLDGYEGWMHSGYLAPVDVLGPRDIQGWPAEARRSLGCTVRDARGVKRALPFGAFVHPDEEVVSGRAPFPDELARECPPEADAIAASAVRYFTGAYYQWGGITPWGCDCSGFVQSIFALHGVSLPRDAWQQGEAGDPGAEELGAARVGDLLFFSDRPDGRITHVGLALGGMRMAHVALGRGGFAIERLDDGRDPYVAGLVERFRFARRPLRAPADDLAAV